MKTSNYIRVVLIEPTHPGNIGATARAMANMGVTDLVLVNPREFPSPVANARAAGADNILENAEIVDSLDEAISRCTLVLGTTARHRSLEWPSLTPWDAMVKVREASRVSKAAILFGRESSGLTNSELDRCHHLVRIPVSDDFSSLNLGTAVAVILYELRKQISSHEQTGTQFESPSEPVATAKELKGFYAHLEKVLLEIEFSDGRSSTLMRKIVRLFNRAGLYKQEVNILRGILSAIEYKVGNAGNNNS